jgi:hypothetical protein
MIDRISTIVTELASHLSWQPQIVAEQLLINRRAVQAVSSHAFPRRLEDGNHKTQVEFTFNIIEVQRIAFERTQEHRTQKQWS